MQQQANFNQRHRAAPLEPLSPGTRVHYTSHDKPGTVVEKADAPRSYIIETPTKNIRRNREHLVPLEPASRSPKSPQKSRPTVVVKDPELNVNSRPKKTVRSSLKALENMAASS